MKLAFPSHRTIDCFAFLSCCALIALVLFLEMYEGLLPCPLCVVQRLVIVVLGLFFLFAALLPMRGKTRHYYYGFVFLMAVSGALTAARQVWLGTLPPDQVPACGASFSGLFEMLPAIQAIQLVFQGSGDCAKVTWRFLELSMPMWSLLCFIGFALVSLWQTKTDD